MHCLQWHGTPLLSPGSRRLHAPVTGIILLNAFVEYHTLSECGAQRVCNAMFLYVIYTHLCLFRPKSQYVRSNANASTSTCSPSSNSSNRANHPNLSAHRPPQYRHRRQRPALRPRYFSLHKRVPPYCRTIRTCCSARSANCRSNNCRKTRRKMCVTFCIYSQLRTRIAS